MRDGQAYQVDLQHRLPAEFSYVVQPSLDFISSQDHPVPPIHAALAAGYHRNAKLFPIFRDIVAKNGELVSYDQLEGCSMLEMT